MSSTSGESYGLPTNAPPFVEERPLGEPARFAIFHTISMDDSTRQGLERSINKVDSGDATHSKLAPLPDFTGRPLRDVYDHFITLRENDESIQPFYFIVADEVDFKEEGVLVVCLDRHNEGDGEVGVARCPVDMADWWGAGFYYDLSQWEELQEAEQVEYGPLEDPEKEYDTRPGPIRLRSMYGWYSLVEKAVPINQMLDPLWLDRHPDECRFQMLGNWHASNDPWAEICRQHPQQAALRPRIHRQIVLVAENEDANDPNGIIIARLESERKPKVLARVSAGTAIAEADAIVKRLELWNPWEPPSYRTLM